METLVLCATFMVFTVHALPADFPAQPTDMAPLSMPTSDMDPYPLAASDADDGGIALDGAKYNQQVTTSQSEFYRDCQDAYENGLKLNGIYTIQPDEDQPFQVYCDMETDGGGWTVFQRRNNGSVDFYNEWVDYVQGFGNLMGEFWLGLAKLHRITSSSQGAAGNELRVDMKDFESRTAYAKYGSFAIGDSTAKYILTVSGYSGTAGDSLTYHNGFPFSTKDQDNDGYMGNCAVTFKGAWWYKVCHYSNLNGLYWNGHHDSYADGVNWFYWKGYHYSLKFTEMKVRRQ